MRGAGDDDRARDGGRSASHGADGPAVPSAIGTGAGQSESASERAADRARPCGGEGEVYTLKSRAEYEAWAEACQQLRLPGLLAVVVQRVVNQHGANLWRGFAERFRLYEAHLTDPEARQRARENAEDAERRGRDADHEESRVEAIIAATAAESRRLGTMYDEADARQRYRAGTGDAE